MEDGAGRGEHHFLLAEAESAALRGAVARHRVTLNTLVQGAWALLLARCCGTDEGVHGATVAGRPAELEGAEEMIGLFINTLPVRVRHPSDAPVGTWLAELQARMAEARQYEYAPLADVLAWSGVPRGTPLFDTLLVFENFPLGEALRGGGGPEVKEVRTVERGSYPLALVVVPSMRLGFRLVFEREHFAPDAVERLGEQLRVVLRALAEDLPRLVGDVGLLGTGERRRVLDASRGPGLPPGPLPVHRLFERQARAAPGRVAVRCGDEELTYGELERRSARLARTLRGLGVGPEVRVGVCAELSPDAMVGILAVLRAGGAYLPLDPAHPAERLAGILADAAAPVLLTTESLLPRLPLHGARTVLLDAGGAPDDDALAAPPDVEADPGGLAYVIFTSGSTGTPKGVEVGHHNLACSTGARFALYPEPVGGLLLLSSLAFDTSVAGIFWTLCSGGTLHLPPARDRRDPARLVELAVRGGATHLLCVPSLYAALLDEVGRRGDWAPESVLVAGEACPPELAERHARLLPRTVLRNEYGPTEGTVWCTVYECGADAPAPRVPIGRAIPGSSVYLLDREASPAPDGVPGELYVGGSGVARGYLGRPGATAGAFVPDPFMGEPGARMYRTGDRARRRPDGELEFLGRLDEQVKVRGHRVEPGEVEAALLTHPAVAQAAVATRPDPRGEPRLVAWVAAGGGAAPSAGELRAHLHARLPGFMVPAALVVLDVLPRTPGGKTDRRALPDPEWGRGAAGAHRPPGTPVEEVVAGIWEEVLGVEGVGADDDFFALGGHSLLAMRLSAQLRELLRVEVSVAELFGAPTVAGQAERAGEIGRGAGVDVERVAGIPPAAPPAPGRAGGVHARGGAGARPMNSPSGAAPFLSADRRRLLAALLGDAGLDGAAGAEIPAGAATSRPRCRSRSSGSGSSTAWSRGATRTTSPWRCGCGESWTRPSCAGCWASSSAATSRSARCSRGWTGSRCSGSAPPARPSSREWTWAPCRTGPVRRSWHAWRARRPGARSTWSGGRCCAPSWSGWPRRSAPCSSPCTTPSATRGAWGSWCARRPRCTRRSRAAGRRSSRSSRCSTPTSRPGSGSGCRTGGWTRSSPGGARAWRAPLRSWSSPRTAPAPRSPPRAGGGSASSSPGRPPVRWGSGPGTRARPRSWPSWRGGRRCSRATRRRTTCWSARRWRAATGRKRRG